MKEQESLFSTLVSVADGPWAAEIISRSQADLSVVESEQSIPTIQEAARDTAFSLIASSIGLISLIDGFNQFNSDEVIGGVGIFTGGIVYTVQSLKKFMLSARNH